MTEPFGDVLRRYRLAAGLTQERLAETARVSANGVAALEAGRSRLPRLTTVTLLADALALEGTDRATLLAAASPDHDLSGPLQSARAIGTRSNAGVLLADAMLGPVGGWRHPFIGRSQTLALLDATRLAGARLVVLSGDAGIGKTRLAHEFARQARAEGVVVLWGRWTEEHLGPFAGFVGPIRQAAELIDHSAATGLGQLLRVAPGLWGQSADAPIESHADSGVERRLMFEAVSRLMGLLGPTILVLDDLHWADLASISLLEHLTTDPSLGSLVVAATTRSSDLDAPTAGALADIGRRTVVERVVLGGLDHEEIARLVASVAGTSLPEGLVEHVWTACEGNAFFAEELSEHLLSTSSDGGQIDLPRRLPERIQDVLNRRIDALPSESRSLLRVGAVLGREFDPWLAGEIADLTGGALIAATEDVLLSGLAEEVATGRLGFSHGLVQAAALAQLSSLRRIDLHRRAAIALERADDCDVAAVADIARHWAAVALTDRSAVTAAATWAMRAGDAAMAAAATDEAIARYEQASTLWSASTLEHADALIRLGTALDSRGRTTEADDRFRAALHLAQGLSDAKLIARAALGLSRRLSFGRTDQERVSALVTAIDGLDADDEVLKPAATVMLLRQLTFDRTSEGTVRKETLRAEVARAMDRPDAPEDLLMIVGSIRDSIPLMDPDALATLVTRMLGVAGERGDLSVLANAWWAGAWSALERADRDQWDRCLVGYESVAERLGLPIELSSAASLRSCEAQFEGRLDDARDLADQALLHARSIGEPNAEVIYMARSVLIGLDEGKAADLLPVMVSLADDYSDVSTFVAGLCLTAALADDVDLASHLLAEHNKSGFRDIPWDVEWLAVMAFYSHACATIDHHQSAEALFERLSVTTAKAVRVGALTGWWGPVDHHLGALCQMLGRSDEAKARLLRAIAIEEAMGAAPFLERSRNELARVTRSQA